ncbi:MAG: DUF2764 family protein [Chlamydiales bacterium]|nr:DUF2764 domain-containing protein [Chlamydiales bacterium]NCF70368.1 DUF2764 family protein [Chlamydiales bacterium]
MANYYFLSTLFPPLELGHTPQESFASLLPNVIEELNKEDRSYFELLRLYFDIQNLKAYMLQEPLNSFANLSTKEQIQENLEQESFYPNFVFEFFSTWDSDDKRLENYADLLRRFYSYADTTSSQFLSAFFEFERKWRIVMVGFRSKHIQADVQKQLQFEDPYETTVAQVLAQKDAKNFEPPTEFAGLKDLFERWKLSPKGLLKALEQYRLDHISNLAEGELFSFDAIAAYLIKLAIVEQWHQMEQSSQLGSENINKILEEVR